MTCRWSFAPGVHQSEEEGWGRTWSHKVLGTKKKDALWRSCSNKNAYSTPRSRTKDCSSESLLIPFCNCNLLWIIQWKSQILLTLLHLSFGPLWFISCKKNSFEMNIASNHSFRMHPSFRINVFTILKSLRCVWKPDLNQTFRNSNLAFNFLN